MSIFDVDKYFIVKDWGINPYDPDSTWDGLKKLKLKELMRMAKALTDVDVGMKSNYESYKEKDSYAKRDTLIGWIMGLIYFND